MANPIPPTLDSAQLGRIEGVHRGFLYQHLYGVGAMLLAQDAGTEQIVLEHDEDVEIRSAAAHVYVQVKTRKEGLLAPSDVKGLLKRVNQLRATHRNGTRVGKPTFYVVSNVGPGPTLLQRMNRRSWPADLIVCWPGADKALPPGLPPVWPTVAAGLLWCEERAQHVPAKSVKAETLVLKLAAIAQLVSSGGSPYEAHTIRVADLPVLFEQIALDLQDFPEVPEAYRPHANEPDPVGDIPVRLITGLPGSGKSAWAAQVGSATPTDAVYRNLSGAGPEGLRRGFPEQIAARLFTQQPEVLAAVLRPFADPVDTLRAVSVALGEQQRSVIVVLDDVQTIPAEHIATIVRAARGVRWILLSHPGDVAQELAARLEIAAMPLSGWSNATIAEEFAAAGCRIEAQEAERVKGLTGGLPLFVRNAAELARSRYGGDVNAMCRELEAATHPERTAQEVLLARSVSELPESARILTAVLCDAATVLTRSELDAVGAGAGLDKRAVAAAMRETSPRGMSRDVGDGRIRLHEAFRLTCVNSEGLIPGEQRHAVLSQLCDLFRPSFKEGTDLERAVRYIHLLPPAGRYAELIEIAENESEWMLETGVAPRVHELFESEAADPARTLIERFWLLDALAFWNAHYDIPNAAVVVKRMEAIVAQEELGPRPRLALAFKQLTIAALSRDIEQSLAALRRIEAMQPNPRVVRAARYNHATTLFNAGQFRGVERLTRIWVSERYNELGLTIDDVERLPPDAIARRLPEAENDADEMKRVADIIDLLVQAQDKLGNPYPRELGQALKFYLLARSHRSAIQVGLHLAKAHLRGDHNPAAAMRIFQGLLLPLLEAHGLVEYDVGVRSQYAEVLARMGRIQEAEAELARVAHFATGENEEAAIFAESRRIVEQIRSAPGRRAAKFSRG